MLIVIKNMLGYLRPYKLLVALFLLTLLLDLVFVSLAPLSFMFIIDKAIEPGDIDYFFFILQVLAIAGVICILSGIISDYILAKLTSRIQIDLQKQLFTHMQHLSVDFFQKRRAGDLVSYFTVDLPAIGGALSAILTTGIQSFVVVLISSLVLFYLQWSMALIILIGAALIFVGPYLLGRQANSIFDEYKQQIAELTSEVQENVKAQKVIKGFNLQESMLNRFNERLKTLLISRYRLSLVSSQLGRIPMISLLLVNFSIIGFGSYLALKGHITVGSLVAFFTMYTSMGNSVFTLATIIPDFTDAEVSMRRIAQVLKQPKEEIEATEALQLAQQKLDIQVDGVTFGYAAEEPILKQVSLHIPAGTSAALVGSSGSGKSTLVQLLLGFYQPNEGSIRINGSNLETLDRGMYRQQLGVVFQDNFLFQGTVLDNIRLSKSDASLAEVIEAAKQAEIHDYMMTLPDGYDTVVLDEGSNFSGGQRQRFAIARAILRDPALLLLDEATSALDPLTEEALNQTFEKLAHGRTLVTVTHRLASIIGVDQIFVFNQGELLESGTHQQLLANNGFYKQLWNKQSGLSLAPDGQEAVIAPERLARLPFFQGIDLEVLQEVSQWFTTETFAAGESIIREAEPGEKFYLIARGRVEITKLAGADRESVRVAVLEDGDHFGEIALLENVPRTATVTALTPCILLSLQRKVLYHILAEYPGINTYVRKILAERRQ